MSELVQAIVTLLNYAVAGVIANYISEDISKWLDSLSTALGKKSKNYIK